MRWHYNVQIKSNPLQGTRFTVTYSMTIDQNQFTCIVTVIQKTLFIIKTSNQTFSSEYIHMRAQVQLANVSPFDYHLDQNL